MSNCPDCNHPAERHIGVVDMGGGHSEAIGCTVPSCDCMLFEFEEEMGYL